MIMEITIWDTLNTQYEIVNSTNYGNVILP